VLTARGEDGEFRTEQSPVPLSHAEALVEVAPGRLAFDRTEIPLGLGADGFLDRFIVPSGFDLLTVNISSDPRLFAPALWFGREVTDDPQFETGQLAINGVAANDPGEVSNDALEALLDWIEGRSIYSWRPAAGPRVEPFEVPHVSGAVSETAALSNASTVVEVLVRKPEGLEADHAALEPQVNEETDRPRVPAAGELGTGLIPEGEEIRSAAPHRLKLRGEEPDLEDGIARLARSLAPRRFLARSAAEPAN
jgi:hypothetical protein